MFTRAGRGSVPAARDAFETAAHARGWTVRRIRDTATFCRLVVSGDDELLVDLALDSPPNLPPSASIAGPTFGLEELAGRKVIALFDRAEARDFADVYALAQRYPNELLLRRAAEIDAGFDKVVFATMLGTLTRFTDDEIPLNLTTIPALRYEISSADGAHNSYLANSREIATQARSERIESGHAGSEQRMHRSRGVTTDAAWCETSENSEPQSTPQGSL